MWIGYCASRGPSASLAAVTGVATPISVRGEVLRQAQKPKNGRFASTICGVASCLAVDHLEWRAHRAQSDYGILTDAQIAEIGAAHTRKMTLLDEANTLTDIALARKMGVSRERVRQILRDRFGVAAKHMNRKGRGRKGQRKEGT